MTESNNLSERWAKEGRAENFDRTSEIVPVLPDVQLERLIGERIGGGSSRDVFVDRENTNRVIKRAKGSVGANWIEYLVWVAARDTRWKDVLTECFSISQSGKFLCMERVQAPIEAAQYPNVPIVPWWLQDLQPKNFGTAPDGSVKVCDYAMVSLGFDLDEALPHKPGFAGVATPKPPKPPPKWWEFWKK
jgi:hypothetical protein